MRETLRCNARSLRRASDHIALAQVDDGTDVAHRQCVVIRAAAEVDNRAGRNELLERVVVHHVVMSLVDHSHAGLIKEREVQQGQAQESCSLKDVLPDRRIAHVERPKESGRASPTTEDRRELPVHGADVALDQGGT